jgi:hypothetical protein
MAIALVNRSTLQSSGNTPAISTTGASLLVVVCGTYYSPNTPTDSESNTWTALTLYGSEGAARIWYVNAPTTSASHTVSISGTSYQGYALYAFSGTAASPFDSESGNSANNPAGATISPGSITPAEDNSLLIACFGGAFCANIQVSSPYSSAVLAWDQDGHVGMGAAYTIQTSKAASNPAWTWSSGGFRCGTALAVFKAAAGSGASKPVLFHSHFRSQGW